MIKIFQGLIVFKIYSIGYVFTLDTLILFLTNLKTFL